MNNLRYPKKHEKRRRYNSMISLDLTKTFDKVWLNSLLIELHLIKMPLPTILLLIKSNFGNRFYQVKLGSVLFNFKSSKQVSFKVHPWSQFFSTSTLSSKKAARLSLYTDNTARKQLHIHN